MQTRQPLQTNHRHHNLTEDMNKLECMRNAFETGDCKKSYYIENIHDLHTPLFNYPSFLKDTDVESISLTPYGIYIRSISQEIDLYLDPMDQHLVPYSLMNFRSYDIPETEFLKSIANNNCTIFDIGANCGWYSLSLAKRFSGATVFAFEPIKKTHDILLHNIQRNGLTNIEAHQIGISNHEGVIDFLYTPSCSGATSLKLAGQPVNSHSEIQKISCKVTTLDTFCEERLIFPQIIKCDVEGAELMVVQGGIETISTSRPVILLELLRKWAKKFDYHPNSVIKLLKDVGYSAYTLNKKTLTLCDEITDTTQETNFFFLHHDEHSEIIKKYS